MSGWVKESDGYLMEGKVIVFAQREDLFCLLLRILKDRLTG
jgi:hypothetical protein